MLKQQTSQPPTQWLFPDKQTLLLFCKGSNCVEFDTRMVCCCILRLCGILHAYNGCDIKVIRVEIVYGHELLTVEYETVQHV